MVWRILSLFFPIQASAEAYPFYFAKNLPVDIINVHKSVDGRKLLINVKIDQNIITLVNIYAPNNEQHRVDFFKRIQSFINQHSLNTENIIMCGDFNFYLKRVNDKSAVKLSNISNNLSLYDVWNERHENVSGFTLCDADNVPKRRIDYVFLSRNFIYDVKQIIVRKIPGTHANGCRLSDHRALKCTFYLSTNQKGSGYWKLNTSYLDNLDYIQGIKDIIENVKNNVNGTHIQRWETLKYDVKLFSVNYAKQYQKNIKDKILYLEKEITNMEEASSEHFNMNRKRELENELSELCDSKFKGAQIRSRAQWIENGEKSTSYFLSLENKHQSSNVIKELVNENGNKLTSDNKILGEMCNFYEKLYTSKNIESENIDRYLSTLENISCLSNEEKNICDMFPTLEECESAVNDMKTNKSPGNDGIPNEFYKTFWKDLHTLFYDALRDIYDENEMGYSQKMAIMSLIYKKGDRKDLKNYRPISLTNSDYKIIAFVFARRLQKVIDKLISRDQSAYIKGRYIGENASSTYTRYI